MSSLTTYEYYKEKMTKIPPLRAIAETLLCDPRIRKVTPAEAYEMSRKQWDVVKTDLPIYPSAARRLGLPKGARVLNNCHGKILGRTAKARRFYNRLSPLEQQKVLADCREAVSDLQKRPLIKGEGIVGLDTDLMIKAIIIGGEDDAVNIYTWLTNFTPFDELREKYAKSKKLAIQDIIIIADNLWCNEDPFYHNLGLPQLALVDQQANVIYNFGMRYFGERKKGTLTLAWTSGMRLGMAACHGGIKELDFGGCEEKKYRALGKRSVAFFGLSGTGKSSHTNSHDNGGTMPKGFGKVVLHDDAFQIDCKERVCRVWEPSLFDKTDSRPLDHPDWEYMITTMNLGLIDVGGKILPLGEDIRNANGRAIIDRDILGEWVNKCAFPDLMAWLMKDTCLPPLLRFESNELAVAMGASLMTRRNRAENVSEEELCKLVFEPFANPFRVYELWKDVEAFLNIFKNGAVGYCFNSVGFWRESDEALNEIPLQTSLTLQTAILTDALEWEDWNLLPGARMPSRESVERLLPGYYDTYNSDHVGNRDRYLAVLKDRFGQRRAFLENSDLTEKPELLKGLLDVLVTNG